MESIKLLARNTVSACLFNALSEVGKRNVLEMFNITPQGDDSVVDVVLTVNGVDVSFSEIINVFEKQFDKEVERKAKQILKDQIFPNTDELTDKLWDFQRSLETLQDVVNWHVDDHCRTIFGKED